jgi:hypothetical protein
MTRRTAVRRYVLRGSDESRLAATLAGSTLLQCGKTTRELRGPKVESRPAMTFLEIREQKTWVREATSGPC